ncbi:hypothetical protein ACFQAS_02570 [Halopenitus salinus]|uniref:Uncharacterized protein n=1 Tax=Halopenitus salinus TaxID=1198295 RepID=A0ABD5UR36_9EURY
MPKAGEAIENAARLEEIEFPEFTSQLISDTFNAIVTSMIRQQEAYADLLEKVSQSVADFEQESVSARDVTQWLIGNFPGDSRGTTTVGTLDDPGTLSETELEILERKLTSQVEEIGVELPGPGDASGGNGDEATYDLTEDDVGNIRDAARRKIARPRLEALQDLVSQGIVRVVVDDGTIETRVIFETVASEYDTSSTYESERTRSQYGGRAGLTLGSFSIGGYGSRQTTSVSTMTERERSSSRASVEIMGGVTINVRGDYQALRPEGGGEGEGGGGGGGGPA